MNVQVIKYLLLYQCYIILQLNSLISGNICKNKKSINLEKVANLPNYSRKNKSNSYMYNYF